MNEFVSKKLGEVMAFSVVGVKTIGQGRAALATVFNDLDDLEQTQIFYQTELTTIAGDNPLFTAKAEGTGAKLTGMRDAYIGDEWDNPVEIMEWLGFFEGAAIVHWSLVGGAAAALDLPQLAQLTAQAVDFHQKLLSRVTAQLAEIGRGRARAS
jgi:hypothetical protein